MDNNIVVEKQGGSRKDRSCLDNQFKFTSVIQNVNNADKSLFACFIDMQKPLYLASRDLFNFRICQNWELMIICTAHFEHNCMIQPRLVLVSIIFTQHRLMVAAE